MEKVVLVKYEPYKLKNPFRNTMAAEDLLGGNNSGIKGPLTFIGKK